MLKTIFQRIDKTFQAVEEWALFVSVAIALVTAMANVLLRKLTSNVNLYWSDEVVRKTIYFSTYIGCVVAIRGRSLICSCCRRPGSTPPSLPGAAGWPAC